MRIGIENKINKTQVLHCSNPSIVYCRFLEMVFLSKNPELNAKTFRLLLEKLLSKADGTKKKLLLVLDNARYHHVKILQPWLESLADILYLIRQ